MNKYLVKLAQLSSDTKKEVAQTGVMAAAGGATGYAGHKLMQTNAIKRMKIPEGGKAAIAIGGLGLLGDYSAVKLNRHIEKKAYMMENKYLQKAANTYDSTTLAHLRDVDISGVGGIAYAAKKSREKRAGIIMNSLKRGAQRLGGQLKTLGQDFATAPKTMAGMRSMAPSIAPILKNRAVQAGAGVVGAGLVGKAVLGSGQQKQASFGNTYLSKIASQFTEEQAEDMSHPKRLWLTGAFAHRKAINDAGGEASVFDLANRNRMAMYSKDAMKDDLKRHAKVSGTTAAIGAIIGAIAAHSKGKSILGAGVGAGVGALVGAGVGSMGTSNYNLFKKDWGERIPAQVKEDILAGKYDKK